MAGVPVLVPALFASNGASAASGAKLYAYVKGTTTPQTFYTDEAITTPAANPTIANSLGATVRYLDPSKNYDLVAKTSDEATTLFSVTYNVDANNISLGAGWEDVLELPAAGILDNLNGIRSVATYAALTALTTATGLSDNSVYCTYARTTEEDGGAGFWRYDSASTTTANSGTILAIDGGGAGRFFRTQTEYLNPQWFGAIGDGKRSFSGVATSGDATFTDAGNFFEAADVGKTIAIGGAGAAGATLVTTIASINSSTSIELTVAPSTTVAANAQYAYGTLNDTPMANLRAAVVAQLREPRVVWPDGFYLYSTGPNWSIVDLQMDFTGDVTLCCVNMSGEHGFSIDSGSTLASGYCWGVRITGAPKIEMVSGGGHAVFLRGLLRSFVAINARSAGATKAAFRTDFCVACDFTGCSSSNNDQQPGGFAFGCTPAYGIQSTRRGVGENSAHNRWGTMLIEGVDTGVDLDWSTGDVFEAGTIEGCLIGIHGTTNTTQPRFLNIDVEQNTIDLDDDGMSNPVFDWYDADRNVRRTNTRLSKGELSISFANSVVDATNDITFGTGFARDDADTTDIYAHTVMTKRLDATWVAGTNQGGLDTGSIANATYHCFAIQTDASGDYDFLFSTSPTSPTMPTGYTRFRRIGSIVRSGGAIIPFNQIGDEFLWLTGKADVAAGGPSGNALYTLTVPTGIKVRAKISVNAIDLTPAARSYVLFVSPDQTDPSSAAIDKHDFLIPEAGASVPASGNVVKDLRTNTSGQVRGLVTTTTADHTLLVNTYGYIDTRGQ